MYRCPNCRRPLEGGATAYSCEGGHSFDRSREGYVNLLPTRARSRVSGDSPEMMAARRAFLDQGHYEPLRAALLSLVAHGSVLDVGCGEGYYTRPLGDGAGTQWLGGIDISRAAVRLAARRSARVEYAVANAFDLPVIDGSVATAVSVFAPVAPDELARVVSPEGAVVAVVPGPGHLRQLKEVVFETPTGHPMRGPLDDTDHFVVVATERVTFEMHLDGDTAAAVVMMTPYQWQLSPVGRQALDEVDEVDVTADFLVHRYRRRR